MSKIYKIAEVKFNGGAGALLCNWCRTIISRGFDHDDKQHWCGKCQKTQSEPLINDRSTK
jgi:hypothetical protein